MLVVRLGVFAKTLCSLVNQRQLRSLKPQFIAVEPGADIDFMMLHLEHVREECPFLWEILGAEELQT